MQLVPLRWCQFVEPLAALPTLAPAAFDKAGGDVADAGVDRGLTTK
jgi:hypothetical protein